MVVGRFSASVFLNASHSARDTELTAHDEIRAAHGIDRLPGFSRTRKREWGPFSLPQELRPQVRALVHCYAKTAAVCRNSRGERYFNALCERRRCSG